MHELGLLGIPALIGPWFALRAWAARRRTRTPGATVGVGDRLPTWGPLRATDGSSWGPRDVADAPATVFLSMSNRCPGVKAYDGRIRELAAEFPKVRMVAVNSVPDSLYPSESMAHMGQAFRERGLELPYLKDHDQRFRRVVGAACTPQAFLVDRAGVLRYRGRIDDSFLEDRVRVHDLRNALADLLAGRVVAVPETHAVGCAIDDAPRMTNAPRGLAADTGPVPAV